MTSEHVYLEYLNEQRITKTGYDVIFEIGPATFPAHRVVLAERLQHFRNIFTVQGVKKKKSNIPLDPQIIDPMCFDEFLNYVYTNTINLTNENVRAIYKVACYFSVDELVNKIKEHLKSSVQIENVFLYRRISAEFHFKWLEDLCEQFIKDNSSSNVIRNQLISTISFEDLKSLTNGLKQRDKFVEMFNYSVDWILKDRANRAGMLFELFKNIPLERLPDKFLKHTVAEHELVQNDVVCLRLLLKIAFTISETKTQNQNQNSSKLSVSLLCKETKPQIETIYAIGGRNELQLSSVSEYNNLTCTWTATTQMPSPRAHFACAVIAQKIYVCGGHNGRNLNELTVFDARTRTWTQLTPMKHARQLCSAAVLNERIYVAGGMNGNDHLKIMEQYNVLTRRWSDLAPMTTKRSGLELVAFNGFLYAIGGYNGPVALNTVERYNPRTDEWTVMNNTNNKYQAFGSAVLNGNIYIAGKDKCEVYSPADDRWTEMPAPSKCDYGRRLAVCNENLYAIGGLVGTLKDWKGVQTVEVYDSQARVWRREPDMDEARCFHGVAVVKG